MTLDTGGYWALSSNPRGNCIKEKFFRRAKNCLDMGQERPDLWLLTEFSGRHDILSPQISQLITFYSCNLASSHCITQNIIFICMCVAGQDYEWRNCAWQTDNLRCSLYKWIIYDVWTQTRLVTFYPRNLASSHHTSHILDITRSRAADHEVACRGWSWWKDLLIGRES